MCACLCVGYDGEFCQDDADGCETISCLEGQQCFDYPAPVVGAECACPDGYTSDSDAKCVGKYLVNDKQAYIYYTSDATYVRY